MRFFCLICLFTTALLTSGCSSIYYNINEKFGREKRDILIDRVEDARSDQEKAKEQFESALERFRTVVNVDAADLENMYDKLNSDYKRCESRADRVHKRIEEIEDVSQALFDEWENELDDYSNQELRRESERQLHDTERAYDQLLRAMRRAEEKMYPVLEAFEDQVLFLKHNLNAAAIASLQGEVVTLESNVDDLIREMESSIAEADEFLAQIDRK